MINHLDRLFSTLYERCFESSEGPFTSIGNELINTFKLAAVSLWLDNPQVESAPSRIAFSYTRDISEITENDRNLALQILQSKETLSGTYSTMHYFALPLMGKHTNSSLILWSDNPFSMEFADLSVNLGERLAKLIDLVVGLNAPNMQRVSRELQATRFFQQQLMPNIQNVDQTSSIAYRVLPAHELGGDYLDILLYPGGSIGLTVADAMGKGVPGAFVMLVARTMFRMLAKDIDLPSKILYELNNQFISELTQLDSFVTQFFGIYQPKQGKLIYANAGHNLPLIWRKNESRVSVLTGRGIAIGGKENAEYESYSADLNKGDILIVFSDGLKEIKDHKNREFGIEGISQSLKKFQEYDAEGICDGLINTVMRQCDKQSDDMSFLVLKA